MEVKKIDVMPISNNIIMEEINPGEQKVNGIVLPDQHRTFVKRAKIIAVGPGRPLSGVFVPSMCRAGDVVFYAIEQFSPIKFDGAEYLVGNEEGIFAIIEPNEVRRKEIERASITKVFIPSDVKIIDDDKPFVAAPPSHAGRTPREG